MARPRPRDQPISQPRPSQSGRDVRPDGRLVVGLVQMDPALGDRARNLDRHRQWVRQAGEAGVELLVFPELSLTGYFLKDLVAETAISLEGAVMDELRSLSAELDVVLCAVIEEPDHR